MNRTLGFLAATMLLAVVFLVAAFVWPAFLADRTGRALIGKPVVKSIATLLSPEDLKGASYILLSDMYSDECNARLAEFNDLIVKLGGKGVNARMLHIGSHGSPNRSYQEAVHAKRAPTHIVIADSTVAYADVAVRRLQKPCMLELVDGNVVKIRIGSDLEEWISNSMKN